MEVTFIFDAGKCLLHATLVGSFSLSEARTTFMTILDATIQHQARKVLIDCSAVVGEPDTMERFNYSEFVAAKSAEVFSRGLSPYAKFAYILLSPMADSRRFGENVAKNRGMRVKVFDNTDEAEQWLGVAPFPEDETPITRSQV